MATKRIPYGISDFRLLSGEDFYYVDKVTSVCFREKIFIMSIKPVLSGR